MNHTATTPDSGSRSEETQISPLANPRRTRLGSDGRPVAGPVTTIGD